MKRAISFLVLLLSLAGCAQITHLDQLLTIKGLSDNRDAQSRLVKSQNQNFDKLLVAVQDNQLEQFPTTKKFQKEFGLPVIRRPSNCEAQPCEEWIYRYATKYFDAEKVYVYFDPKGKMLRLEHEVPANNDPQYRGSGY